MYDDAQTVRVVSANPASQGPYVVINAGDFDPEVHTLYEPDASVASPTETPSDAPAPKRRGRPPKSAQSEA